MILQPGARRVLIIMRTSMNSKFVCLSIFVFVDCGALSYHLCPLAVSKDVMNSMVHEATGFTRSM